MAREISLYHGAFPETTVIALAHQFLGKHASPSSDAIRIEQKIRLQEALNSLDPIDREILAMRHFEQLTNGEAAGSVRTGQIGRQQTLHAGPGATERRAPD